MKAPDAAVPAGFRMVTTRFPARWVLGLGVWAVIVLAFASQTYGTYTVKREPIAFSQALLWAVNSFIPMDSKVRSILNAVVVILLVFWLLDVFGIVDSLSRIRV